MLQDKTLRERRAIRNSAMRFEGRDAGFDAAVQLGLRVAVELDRRGRNHVTLAAR